MSEFSQIIRHSVGAQELLGGMGRGDIYTLELVAELYSVIG